MVLFQIACTTTDRENRRSISFDRALRAFKMMLTSVRTWPICSKTTADGIVFSILSKQTEIWSRIFALLVKSLLTSSRTNSSSACTSTISLPIIPWQTVLTSSDAVPAIEGDGTFSFSALADAAVQEPVCIVAYVRAWSRRVHKEWKIFSCKIPRMVQLWSLRPETSCFAKHPRGKTTTICKRAVAEDRVYTRGSRPSVPVAGLVVQA